ncbi:hypothetical protein [Nonomuraea soli]|uniref:Trypsin-like serine protease n=1 Tax=Nonomuraea soli TaxID=1032476 RepID=A0A7W0HWD8_9ACTN|nr:hypothetical protein [Nonomuraea soli]MBA2897997.1 hypothetical protein [Nonomuraea soli]
MKRALIALALAGSAVVVATPAEAAVAAVRLANTAEVAQDVARFWLADDGANLRAATPYTVRSAIVAQRAPDFTPAGKPALMPPLQPLQPVEGEAPPTVGKVYFIGSDLQPHWCAGVSVRSTYRNTVATAGHCLIDSEAPMGALWKWAFVPGGASPALYVGRQGFTPYSYEDLRDPDGDVSFTTVWNGVTLAADGALVDAGRLADNVGAQGLAFNQPLGSTRELFGFPSGAHPGGDVPYGGQDLERAAGTTFAATWLAIGNQLVGVDSPFTHSLGTTWLRGYSPSTRLGYLDGLTIGVSDLDGDGRFDTSVSAHFGPETAEAFAAARNIASGTII